jgi:hypothetical protein
LDGGNKLAIAGECREALCGHKSTSLLRGGDADGVVEVWRPFFVAGFIEEGYSAQTLVAKSAGQESVDDR